MFIGPIKQIFVDFYLIYNTAFDNVSIRADFHCSHSFYRVCVIIFTKVWLDCRIHTCNARHLNLLLKMYSSVFFTRPLGINRVVYKSPTLSLLMDFLKRVVSNESVLSRIAHHFLFHHRGFRKHLTSVFVLNRTV